MTESRAMNSWRLMTREGSYPQWVLRIANLLRGAYGSDGEIIGVPAKGCVPLFSLGMAGLFDAARNARALPLQRAGHTVDVGESARGLSAGVCVALADAEYCHQGNLVELRVDGEPACDLAVAVERAMQRGDGSVELEAIWWCGGNRTKLAWRCALKDHSIAKSMDSAATRLVDLMGYVITQLKQVSDFPKNNSVPVLDVPSPVRQSTLTRAFRHAINRLVSNDQWAFRVYQNLRSDLLWPDAENRGIDFVPPSDRMWADPFVAREGRLLWVFFEEAFFESPKGRIACVSIDEMGRCSEPIVVLEESCHLSYPQVFKCDGDWYMLPESSARGDVVLYRAKNFPYKWEPVVRLLTQVRLADATLHRNHAGWWLVASGTGQFDSKKIEESPYDVRLYDTMHLYHSSSLSKGWQPVKHNPLRVDAAVSRSAGPWFLWQGRWIRPVQDCRGRYGRAVHMLAVESISTQGINERALATLSGSGSTNCVHTYSRVGQDLAVDWSAWRMKWGSSKTWKNPSFEFREQDSSEDRLRAHIHSWERSPDRAHPASATQ